MTTHIVADDILGTISRRSWEIQRRMMEGTLEPFFVTENLQRIVEAKEVEVSTQGGVIISPFFANEEVKSDWDYPDGYTPKPICEQLMVLAKHFPNLDADPMLTYSKDLPQMPVGAEHLFVVPKWQKVAEVYNDALVKALGMIESTRTFYNCRKGELGTKYLQQSERTIAAEAMLANQFNGDYMFIWAQFGLRWRGRSVRKARYNYAPSEFGLSAFHSACMLLSHPERLVKWEQLHIDLPGDEYSPDADGNFFCAPLLGFHGDKVGFSAYYVGIPDAGCGSVSGFLPQ